VKTNLEVEVVGSSDDGVASVGPADGSHPVVVALVDDVEWGRNVRQGGPHDVPDTNRLDKHISGFYRYGQRSSA